MKNPPAGMTHRKKIGVLVTYLSLWVAYYILVHATGRTTKKDNDNDDKNAVQVVLHPAVLVLLVEVIKFFVATACYYVPSNNSNNSNSNIEATKTPKTTTTKTRQELTQQLFSSDTIALLHAYIPNAIIYTICNNLSIQNLRYFNPTTYLVFMSFRLLLTAVVWKFTFHKHISTAKWGSLSLITAGILVKAVLDRPSTGTNTSNRDSNNDNDNNAAAFIYYDTYGFHLGLLALQMGLAVVGSVYNEKVLKQQKGGLPDNPHWHNMCLYLACIMTNAIVLLLYFLAVPSSATTTTTLPHNNSNNLWQSLVAAFPATTLASIVALAAAGVSTSLMLRYFDSVTKAVASALETCITAVLGLIIFGYSITLGSAVSILLVSVGACQYAVLETNNNDNSGGGVSSEASTVSTASGSSSTSNSTTMSGKKSHSRRRPRRRLPRPRLVMTVGGLVLLSGTYFVYLHWQQPPPDVWAVPRVMEQPNKKNDLLTTTTTTTPPDDSRRSLLRGTTTTSTTIVHRPDNNNNKNKKKLA